MQRRKKIEGFRCTTINIVPLVIFLFQPNALMWPEWLGRGWSAGEEAVLGSLVLSSAFKALHTLGSISFDSSRVSLYAPCIPQVLNHFSCLHFLYDFPRLPLCFLCALDLECPFPLCADPKPTHYSGPASKIIVFLIFDHVYFDLAGTSPCLNFLGIYIFFLFLIMFCLISSLTSSSLRARAVPHFSVSIAGLAQLLLR